MGLPAGNSNAGCLMQPRRLLTTFAPRHTDSPWSTFCHQDLHIRSCSTAFHLGGTQYMLVHRIVPPQVLDSTFLLIELHDAPVSPFPQLVKVLLHGSMARIYMLQLLPNLTDVPFLIDLQQQDKPKSAKH